MPTDVAFSFTASFDSGRGGALHRRASVGSGRLSFGDGHAAEDVDPSLAKMVRRRSSSGLQWRQVNSSNNNAWHSFTDEETAAFAAHINRSLRGDESLASRLPLDENDSAAVFEAVSDGVILCKLVNLASPNAVSVKKLNVAWPLDRYRAIENCNLLLSGCRTAGCNLVNAGPMDIVDGSPTIVLSITWQLVKIHLLGFVSLATCPDLLFLMDPEDSAAAAAAAAAGLDPAAARAQREAAFLALPAEEILLRWVNHHLEWAGFEQRVANFGRDFADGVVYTVLVRELIRESRSNGGDGGCGGNSNFDSDSITGSSDSEGGSSGFYASNCAGGVFRSTGGGGVFASIGDSSRMFASVGGGGGVFASTGGNQCMYRSSSCGADFGVGRGEQALATISLEVGDVALALRRVTLALTVAAAELVEQPLIRPAQCVAGNKRLNLAFVAQLFNANPVVHDICRARPAAVVIQRSWLDHCEQRRQSVAATAIGCVWMRKLMRMRAARRREEAASCIVASYKARLLARRAAAVRAARHRRWAAATTIIQATYRLHRECVAAKETAAATIIQRQYRQACERATAKAAAEHAESAAAVIQRSYREACKRAEAERGAARAVAAAGVIQRSYCLSRERAAIKAAAALIQHSYRQARKQAAAKAAAEAAAAAAAEDAATNRIQRSWRRHRALQRTCGATGFQRMWRGHAQRATVKREAAAALMIQCRCRQARSKRVVHEMAVEQQRICAAESAGATIVSRWWRRHRQEAAAAKESRRLRNVAARRGAAASRWAAEQARGLRALVQFGAAAILKIQGFEPVAAAPAASGSIIPRVSVPTVAECALGAGLVYWVLADVATTAAALAAC